MDFKDVEEFEDYGFELAEILRENRNKKRINFKKKNRKFSVGDIVYFETPQGIAKDTIMIIDGQELILSDYNSIYKRDCLSEDDPRIKDARTFLPDVPPDDMLEQQRETLRKQGLE